MTRHEHGLAWIKERSTNKRVFLRKTIYRDNFFLPKVCRSMQKATTMTEKGYKLRKKSSHLSKWKKVITPFNQSYKDYADTLICLINILICLLETRIFKNTLSLPNFNFSLSNMILSKFFPGNLINFHNLWKLFQDKDLM
jgi:hypothetical protein